MKKKILFMAFGAALIMVLGAGETGKRVLGGSGKFVFGQVSTESQDNSYMLDTETGRLWLLLTDTNFTSKQLLASVPYLHLDGTVSGKISYWFFVEFRGLTAIVNFPRKND